MQNDSTLPPMKVGSDAEESERLVEEIKNSGVVQSQDAAESAPARDENMTSGDEAPTIPTPVIKRA